VFVGPPPPRAPPPRTEPVLQLRHCPVVRTAMLAEQQPAVRLEHPPQLAKGAAYIGNAAGREGENDSGGAGALEGQRLRPALMELDREIAGRLPAADAVEHRLIRVD